jgi:glycosyltransferase involved in cell wall biosynthesis
MLLRRSSKLGAVERVAFIVSHPIQYYAPLYQRLAQRDDVSIKVFFTWHKGSAPVQDKGFGIPVAWDIPLTEGYDFELVENTATDPGMHHFFGLRNPKLVRQVLNWKPTVVHVTGWAWWSHLKALKTFRDIGMPVLFRGDSNLLSQEFSGPRWWAKQLALAHIFRWPRAFLVTGKANHAYYKAFGVEDKRLLPCPHSIDCRRFAEPNATYEAQARDWRKELGISDSQIVLLFAGKFEHRKNPIEFMKSVESLRNDNVVGVIVGSGELQDQVDAIAKKNPRSFRALPFQNQNRMPIVYRLGDLFVLPSASESWGLGVNEALACNRPVLVSDKVGCAVDVVDATCGYVAPIEQLSALMAEATRDKLKLTNMRPAARLRAPEFDISKTEAALLDAVTAIGEKHLNA